MSGMSPPNSYALACGVGGLIFALLATATMSSLISPAAVAVLLAAPLFAWALFRHPVTALGLLLAFMPFDYMAIELGKFFGLPAMTLVSACTKEIPLLLLLAVLWRRNGYRPAAPDWLLLAFFGLAGLRTLFDGTLTGFAADLSFLLAYAVGAVTVLSPKQERLWAGAAVWIAAILSGMGLIEVFLLGEGPRTLLYLATDSQTEGGQLTASFHAIGFTGLREAATMVGPNYFGALCMIALILWWVYSRNPLPGAMIAIGLICSLTRAAWLGAALAIALLACLMGQKKRLLPVGLLGLGLFAISVPLLGLDDYLLFNRTSQDESADSHRDMIVDGALYAVAHPWGAGNRKLSPLALQDDVNARVFETTYPNLAAEYGIPAALCFVAALIGGLRQLWRCPSRLGYAALGILAGLMVIMIFTLPMTDRRLNAWAWFPIGLALRTATRPAAAEGA
jgi:hypothetical protein